jgi:ATP-dependent Clp protease ATP-binding subunit ClpC
MNIEEILQKTKFDEPRLKMSVLGRFLVRNISFLFNFIFFVGTIFIFIFKISQLYFLGILFLLWWIDKFIHLNDGLKTIREIINKKEINLALVLDKEAYRIIEKSFDESLVFKKDFLEELFFILINYKEIENAIRRLNINPKEFKNKFKDLIEREKKEINKEEILQNIEALIKISFLYSLKNNQQFIGKESIFVSLFYLENSSLKNLLNIFNIKPEEIEKAILFETAKKSFKKGFFVFIPNLLSQMIRGNRVKIKHRVINRAWTSVSTPTLDRFSIDLTDLARANQIGFMIGHQNEYDILIKTLSRPQNPNALLIGDPGIGKETIINNLAWNIVNDNVPKELFDKRLVQLNLSLIIAGADEFLIQKRLENIIEEMLLSQNIILYIPEIHNLVKTSGTAYLSLADALLPIIQNNLFPLIGTTYPKEFRQIIETRSDFIASFEIINVSEISEEEAEKILIYESLIFEKNYKIFITFDAIKSAVHLSKKYLANKFLPSSAEETLKTALTEAKLKNQKIITKNNIIKIIEEKSKIPIHEAKNEEKEILLNLEEIIHKRLINQSEAVKAVSDAIRNYRAGLNSSKGPIASFLFVGPTGVGKTELAKALAEIQFGSEKKMVRLDMSEYQTKESIYQFIGSPDGNISGNLTEKILHNPYSLILLDEFEKAHPDILNLFLQILDDARLTDNLGRVIDFSNTIIIATSNAHADIILEALKSGKSASTVSLYLKEKLTDIFKPELLNRFSKIIVFNELSLKDIISIAQINLKDLKETLLEKGIKLNFTDNALKLLAKLGYDPAFGARPLKRVIEEKIKSPLAKEILEKNIQAGNEILVDTLDDLNEEKFIFNIKNENN